MELESGCVEGRQEGSGSGMTGHPGTIRTGVLASQVEMEIAWIQLQNGMIEDALILVMICILSVENTLKHRIIFILASSSYYYLGQ